MKITFGNFEEIRKIAAETIRSRRNDNFPVYCLEKGIKWEVGEPEGCMMIPDDAGILKITEEFDEDEYMDEDFDGQPSEYEEWQDYYGGDDWDHGQYEDM